MTVGEEITLEVSAQHWRATKAAYFSTPAPNGPQNKIHIEGTLTLEGKVVRVACIGIEEEPRLRMKVLSIEDIQ